MFYLSRRQINSVTFTGTGRVEPKSTTMAMVKTGRSVIQANKSNEGQAGYSRSKSRQAGQAETGYCMLES